MKCVAIRPKTTLMQLTRSSHDCFTNEEKCTPTPACSKEVTSLLIAADSIISISYCTNDKHLTCHCLLKGPWQGAVCSVSVSRQADHSNHLKS